MKATDSQALFWWLKMGQLVLRKGCGLADRERRTPNTPDTLFEMGSITKTFTAAAILRLEMQGKLKTDVFALRSGAICPGYGGVWRDSKASFL